MTLTIVSTNLIGAGAQFTYTAINDQLFIREGVMVASTNTLSPLGGTGLANLILTLAGDLVSPTAVLFSGANADMTILATGSYVSYQPMASSVGIVFDGIESTFTNYGAFHTPDAVGLLLRGENSLATNYGDMLAESPVFFLFSNGSQIVNGGTITATIRDDVAMSERFNNAIFVDVSQNVGVTNLAGGVITASGSTGAGVAFATAAGGGRLNNAGTIVSLQDFGVNLGAMTSGEATITTTNTGTITGFDGSFLGSVNADVLVNRGLLEGDVLMGGGDDFFNTRKGQMQGDFNGGAGADMVRSNAGEQEAFLGGGGLDTASFRQGPMVTIALDGSIENGGAAAGDTYTGFENVIGSGKADRIIGSAAANVLTGAGGADVLTGGAGDDQFVFNDLTEAGDRITDFGVGSDDVLQINASAFGAGLVPGAVAISQFRARTDNVAQDADDVFIYRTTDATLWFDADGNGAGEAVMVANLQDTAVFARADIVLI